MTKKEQDQRDAAFGRAIREFLQGRNHAQVDTLTSTFPTPTITDYGHTTRNRVRMVRTGDGVTLSVSED